MRHRPDPLVDLGRSLFGRRWRRGLICVLEAYFDESESHEPRDVSLVMACVATTERWLAFKKRWTKAQPVGIPIFHAVEWAQGDRGRGRYAPLKPRERRALGRKLHWLISTHTLHSVVEAVPADYYRAEIERVRGTDRSVYSDPYYFCVLSCLTQIA